MSSPPGGRNAMRTLVTFILRLWVDPQVEEPSWEGRVEEVASGERAHIRGPEELACFIEAQTAECRTRRPEARKERNEQAEQRSERHESRGTHRVRGKEET
ncbi:MAG: hypothetical protein JXM73_04730 [Anaerolineae bacterium]|nr:hypothetical protein [Anaerolineae bacterium]